MGEDRRDKSGFDLMPNLLNIVNENIESSKQVLNGQVNAKHKRVLQVLKSFGDVFSRIVCLKTSLKRFFVTCRADHTFN